MHVDIVNPVIAFPAPSAPDIKALMEEHSDTLFGYLLRWTRNRQLAEDIAQETWLRAWRNEARLVESRGSVRGWLLRVAHNLVVDHYRSRQARPQEVVLDADTDAECHSSARDHQRMLDGFIVREALASVSPTLRQALVEVYLLDHTISEASARLGVPIGTVKSRLHYGLRQLRNSMSHAAAA